MLKQHPLNGRFIIYGRVSTTSDEQKNSLTVQTTETDDFSLFEDFKTSYSYTCYGIYSDDTSGTTDNRKDYQEMLTFLGIERKEVVTGRNLPTGNIKRKRHYVYEVNEDTLNHVKNELNINYICCKNTARWTREGDFKLIQILRNNGIYLYFKDESIDTYYTDTDALLGIVQSLDRNKSQDTSKKVKTGFEASIKLGKIRTNATIYGFELIPRTVNQPTKLKPIPEEMKVVRLVYDLYLGKCADVDYRRLGSRQIKNYLEKLGIVTRIKTTKDGKIIGGKPFSVSSIKRMLTNEKYCGCVNAVKKWDSGEVFNHKSPYHIHDYDIMECEYIEPPFVITKEEFLQARELCNERSDKTSPRGRNSGNSVYFGKIKCGVCGSWYNQNGDHNSKGEYIKKMNCGKKKREGLQACSNPNITFTEIEKRYEELAKDFNRFLSLQVKNQKKDLILFLYAFFTYYFIDHEKILKDIDLELNENQKLYDEILVQRVGLGFNAQRVLGERLETVATKILALKEQREDVYKQTESLRPYIDRLIVALRNCESIDTTRTYTVDEIKRFDIVMVTYPDSYHWEMNFEEYDEFLKKLPDIGVDLNLYMFDDRFYIPDNEMNEKLKQYYTAYGVTGKQIYI